LTRTVSAFANSEGGELYVGIDEVMTSTGPARQWRGFENPEAANAHIQVLEGMLPLGSHYEASFLRFAQAPGLVLHITVLKSRDILFASDGKAYVRRGAQKLAVKGDEALQPSNMIKVYLRLRMNSYSSH
jgi:ATP-dependent DNA helicase RecG